MPVKKKNKAKKGSKKDSPTKKALKVIGKSLASSAKKGAKSVASKVGKAAKNGANRLVEINKKAQQIRKAHPGKSWVACLREAAKK